MTYDDVRYNQVRQKSAHNAFQQQEGIYDQVTYWRIRSLSWTCTGASSATVA